MDNVTGIVLDIPANVLGNIKRANDAILTLEQTSKHAAKTIEGNFGTQMPRGVDKFIQAIEKAQDRLNTLKMPTIDTTGLSDAVQELSRAMSTVDRSATTGANRIGKIADAMTKLQTANPNSMLFQNIADGIAKIGNTSQQTIDNVRNLSQIMAQLARDIRTVQQAQSAQSKGTEEVKVSAVNKLYTERIRVMKDLEEIWRHGQIAQAQGKSLTEQETALISQLRSRYQSLTATIEDLRQKKQNAATNDAFLRGDINTTKASIKAVEDRQQKVEQAEKAITRTAEQEAAKRRKTYLDEAKHRADVQARWDERRMQKPANAISYAKQAKTLNDLQLAYKNLRVAMDKAKPDTKEWTAMNTQLEKTRTRIDEIRKKMGEFKSTASGVGDIAGQLARTLAATFSVSAITGYINKMIQVRAQFELQQTALRAILQNKDEADRIFMQVQQLALQSPFSIMQMTSYTKQLAAYRIESEKLVDTTKMLADVSAGLGVDMGRLILAYGQVKAANYLRATEVRQFTEAGLNIAGELANYFSELQGKMISVGDVMDMITKRMVRFEDVEEVFKRVTSAGGLFYDMQKKQSETLWGQLQRIKDAMSIMFNEIGKSNQTAISGALTIIRSLLANWRVFANILNGAGVAMVAYTIKTVAAAVATNTFNTSQKGLVGALARSKAALLAFTKFLSANPYILAITGVVALGSALLDWKQKVDSAREAYDNMIVGISERESKLTSIADKVADTNKRITESQQAMKKSKVGTNEYTDAVEANKQAMLEQNRALQELRNNFPEVYQQMVQTKDGVADLTEGIKAFTESASQQRVITTLQKDNTGWLNDDLKEDLEELAQSQAKYDAAIMSATASSEALFAQVQAIYETEKATGNVSEDISKFYKGLLDLKDQELSKEERLRKIVGLRNQMSVDGMLKLDKAYSDFYGKYQKTINTGGWTNIKGSLEKDTAEATKEIDKLLNNVLVSAGVASVQMFDKLPEGTKKSTEIALNGFIKDLGLSLDEAQKTLLTANLFAPLKITPYWNMAELPQQMSFLQEKINGYIDEHKIGSIAAKIQVTDNTDSYFDGLTKQWRAKKDEIEQLERATTRIAKNGNKARIAELEVEKKALEDMFKAFGIEWRTKQEINGGRQKDIWTPRLTLMQKVNKEYEKLLKYYSQEEAMAKIRTSYGDAVAEAFKDTQWADISKWGTFDAQATVDRLKKLAEVAGKDAKKKILEAAGTIEAEIEIKVKEGEIQKAKDDIQKAFDNYELTKTLGNLGLNVDLTYMVGGQPMTLPQIRKDIEDKLKVAKATDGQEELVKTYEDYLRKVADMENKAAVERLKNYYKYSLEATSARVQLELKAQQEISKIMQDETLNADTKNMAVANVNKQLQQDLAKQAWKEFQESDTYINMFKDIERASTESIERMLAKLNELRGSLKNLPADQVRAIVRQMEQLNDVLIARNPFKGLADGLKDTIKYLRERKQLEEDIARTEKMASWSKDRMEAQEKLVFNLQLQYDAAKNNNAVSEEELAIIKQQLDKAKELLGIYQTTYKAQSDSLDKLNTKQQLGQAKAAAIQTAFQQIKQYAQESVSHIDGIVDGLDKMGMLSDAARDNWESFMEGFSAMNDIAEGGVNTMTGYMTGNYAQMVNGILQGIKGTVNFVAAVFGVGDKKKERQIQRLQDKVEDLEKAYEKLGQEIERAYSYNDYKMGYEQSLQNLEDRKAAINEQIALEKAKKKSDKGRIKELEESLDSLTEQERELRNQFYEDWGSYGDDQIRSAGEEFVSVWLNAYKETGDGLDALNNKWDEFFENLLLKQAASAIVNNKLKKYIDRINAVLDTTGLSEAETSARMKEIIDEAKSETNEVNRRLEEWFSAYGVKGGTGSLLLSDLQKGIQNITEPQAAAIEAYLNSMRFAVFEQNNILTEMLTAIQSQYGTSTDNPILSEVKAIRSLVASIDERLSRVIIPKNSAMSSYVMKVS